MERGNELDLNYPGYWFNKWEHLTTDRMAREKGYDLDDLTKKLGAKKGLRELAHDLQDDPRLLRETADTYYFYITTSRKLFAAKQQPYQAQSIQSITSPFYLEPLYGDEDRVAGYSVRAALPAKDQINTFFNKDDPNNGADYVQALSKETDQTFGIHFSKTKNIFVVQIVEADMNVDPYGRSFTLKDAIEILWTLQAKGFATTLRDHPRPPSGENEHGQGIR